MAGEDLTEASFIADHGLDALVKMGDGEPTTLEEALFWESVMCPASEEAITNPELRIKKLAQAAHNAGSLQPKYAHLVEP